MDITLSAELQQFVDERIKSGRYTSANEMVNAAMVMFKSLAESEEDEDQAEQDLAQLKNMIQSGVAQADRGEVAPWDPEDLMRRVRSKIAGEQKAV